MPTPFRWGILGTGNIAKQFANGLKAVPDARLVAVGSRSPESAGAFAVEFKADRAHGTYEGLASDPEVDAIYIATPHPLHRDNALLCLDHGKPVLCEKPFTVNLAEAKAIVAKARRKKLFCMEAMWTRFLPITVQVRQWLADKAIGEVRLMTTDFGFRCGWNPESRLLDPKLAGGALLDVGCYTLAYARMVFGADPKRIQAAASIGATKVDEQVALVAQYAGGALATLTAAVRTNTNHDVWIYGTEGRIHVPGFWHGRSATLHRDGKEPEKAEPAFVGNGYNYQAIEVADCVRAGRSESAIVLLAESLAIMATMDEVRRQIGLTYPMDRVRKSGSPEVRKSAGRKPKPKPKSRRAAR
jgi:dihydrodiol dehydrogenase / D-xylose 1-dehydrogenase (NADP)